MTETFNAASYLVDRQVQNGSGDRTAVTGPGGTLTYTELADRIAEAAAGWGAIGLRSEERVLLYACDGPDMLVALLSILRCGAVPVPVSTLYPGSEIAFLLRDSRARFLVVGDGLAQQATTAVAEPSVDLRGVITFGPAAIDLPREVVQISWHRELITAGSDPVPVDATTTDSPALWLYTSGTTGMPKAAIHRHGSIRVVADTYGRNVLGLGPEDRCLSASKMSFAYGLGNSCLLPLGNGSSTILDSAKPTPTAVAQRLVADRPTVFFAVPSVYAALLRAEDLPAGLFSSVRCAVSAGEPLPAELHRRIRDQFGVELLNGLGTTETLHIFLSQRPGHARPGTTGTAVPGYEVRLIDDNGDRATVGDPGMLQVKAPSAAGGYWNRPAVNAAVFQGNWITTGDRCVQDEDGHYTCLGRTSDLIKTRGLWVAPVEVETRLLEHPHIAAAGVVAVPDDDDLDQIVAVVVPEPGIELDPASVHEFCMAGLHTFKRPRHVLVFDDLPAGRTGKLDRRALRELAKDRLGCTAEAAIVNRPIPLPVTSSFPAPNPLDLMFHHAACFPSTPQSGSNVGALLRLSGRAPTLGMLRSRIADRIDRLPALKYHLTGAGGEIRWETADIDIDVHVAEKVLPAGEQYLDEAVARLRLTALPPGAPPWRIWLLHGYSIEHYTLFYLARHDTQDAGAITAALETWFGADSAETDSGSAVISGLLETPPATLPDFVGVLDEMGRCTNSHGRWQNDRHPLSGERSVYWREISTDLLRATGRAVGGTVNDVHLAALAHAVSTWAARHWPQAAEQPVPIMVPLNLRAPTENNCPGNHFFLSRIDIPGGRTFTPLRSLAEAVTAAAPLKSIRHRAALRHTVQAVPRHLLDRYTAASTTPAHLSIVGSIFTFRNQLTFAGDPVERIAPLICCPDGFPATISLFRYLDISTACFHVDRALPGVEQLPDLWVAAVEAMAATSNVTPMQIMA